MPASLLLSVNWRFVGDPEAIQMGTERISTRKS